MDPSQVDSLGARAAERWFRHALLGNDPSIADEIFTPDVVLHSAAGDVSGIDAMQALALELRGLEGVSGELVLASEGEKLAVTIFLRGRHARRLWGVPATGRWIEARAVVSVRTQDGKLAELWKTCVVRHLDGSSPGASPARLWASSWGLTPREALVAQLAMSGHTDKEIATELSLATTSVSKYLRSVLRKAGVVSRGALAERAGVIRLG